MEGSEKVQGKAVKGQGKAAPLSTMAVLPQYGGSAHKDKFRHAYPTSQQVCPAAALQEPH